MKSLKRLLAAVLTVIAGIAGATDIRDDPFCTGLWPLLAESRRSDDPGDAYRNPAKEAWLGAVVAGTATLHVTMRSRRPP
jgi:hypothetical protein